MKIKHIEVIPFDIPYRKPVSFGKHGLLTHADHVLVRIITDDGLVGTAEATPRPTIYGESQVSIVHALRKWFVPMLIGENPYHLEQIWEKMSAIQWNPTAKGAIDIAIHDILAQAAKVPLFEYLGGSRGQVEVSYMIGIQDSPEGYLQEAKEIHEKYGIRAFKIKVGKNPENDLKTVELLCRSFDDDFLFYVDGNQAYQPWEAVSILTQMAEFGIKFAEEPVPVEDTELRKKVAAQIPIPILADDSVFTPKQVVKELINGAVGIIGIKPPRTGIRLSVKIVHLSEQWGLPNLVGSQGVSGIGTMAGAHFAAGFSNIKYPNDLTYFYKISDDLLADPIVVKDGKISLSDKPGIGLIIDEEKLNHYRVD